MKDLFNNLDDYLLKRYGSKTLKCRHCGKEINAKSDLIVVMLFAEWKIREILESGGGTTCDYACSQECADRIKANDKEDLFWHAQIIYDWLTPRTKGSSDENKHKGSDIQADDIPPDIGKSYPAALKRLPYRYHDIKRSWKAFWARRKTYIDPVQSGPENKTGKAACIPVPGRKGSKTMNIDKWIFGLWGIIIAVIALVMLCSCGGTTPIITQLKIEAEPMQFIYFDLLPLGTTPMVIEIIGNGVPNYISLHDPETDSLNVRFMVWDCMPLNAVSFVLDSQ